jgi:hypothetical protein
MIISYDAEGEDAVGYIIVQAVTFVSGFCVRRRRTQ